MRVAVLELPARSARPDLVAAEAAQLLAEGPCDLCLLPECALFGYVSPAGDFDLTRFAEPLEGRALELLRGLARAAGCAVAGPVVLRERDEIYNAHVVVDRAGQLLARYAKRHPWYPEAWASPGRDAPPLFHVGGVACTLAICFDVHFLASEASALLHRADLLLFPSAWVDEDAEDARGAILTRLSAEHDLVIANANWGLGEPLVRGQGGSRIVLPRGGGPRLARVTGPARLDAEVEPRR